MFWRCFVWWSLFYNFFINQFNGININNFYLPDRFDNLSDKEKNEIIFKKENKAKYKYESNDNKINLILNKINDIRREKNIPLLDNDGTRYLPDFIINEKTELFFNPNENIYKLSPNYYIFKYPKDEFQNNVNNNDIINIITNGLLDRINIIEKNDVEYISIYNSNYNNNIKRKNVDININIPSFRIDNNIVKDIDIANINDKFSDTTKRLSVTHINDEWWGEFK